MPERRRPHDLLGWFLRGFRAEMPEVINAHKTDRTGLAIAGGFLAYLEDDTVEEARLTDEGTPHIEESYRYPMRTALRALAGDSPEYRYMAHLLYVTACRDGDWDAACESKGIPQPMRRHYIGLALAKLHERYAVLPPAQVLPFRRNSIRVGKT